MKPCVLCGGSVGKPIWREQEVDILRCGGCGLIYTDLQGDLAETFWKEPRPEKLDREDFYWDTARAPVYDEVLDLLGPPAGLGGPEGARMLDVGCGKGFFLKRAADRGWKVYGLELSPHAFRFARERLGLQGVSQGRFENADFPAGTFQVITLWDVIEHLPDPGPMLVKAADLLGDEGVLFIQTPNIGFHLPYAHAKRLLALTSRFRRSRKHLLEAKHHLVQFSQETLTRMLGRAGFREVAFHVLRPIESVAGSRSARLASLKRAYAHLAAAVFDASRGRILIANTLHVFATRGRLPPRLLRRVSGSPD
jgi:2-polyprenyl-3-methyl-5-hydroxy-6-metoxy-1,4-benzoquinol methylase